MTLSDISNKEIFYKPLECDWCEDVAEREGLCMKHWKGVCPNCEHIKGGVEEDCPCGREDLHIEGKGRHPRCKCECHDEEESK